jgi:hypothetical protein
MVEKTQEKIKNSELVIMLRGFEGLKALEGRKFTYAIQKNKKIISNEMEIVNASLKIAEGKTMEDLQAYEKAREELLLKYGQKTEVGALDIDPITQKVPITNVDAFNTGFGKLGIKYKDALAEQDKLDVINQEIMDAPANINFFKIDLDIVPESISNEQMSIIFLLIKEDDDDSAE